MRLPCTNYRLWLAASFAMWIAYLALDYLTDPRGIIALALHRYRVHGPDVAVIERAIVPCLIAALIATVLGWLGQAVAVRLGFRFGGTPDAAMVADFDDVPRQP